MSRLLDFLEGKCTQFAANPFLVSQAGTVLSYKEFYEHIYYTTELLRDKNIASDGINFSIIAPNCLSYLYLLFAMQKSGNTAVNLNPMLADKELENRLNIAEVELLITTKEIYNRLKEILQNTPVKRIIFINPYVEKMERLEYIILNPAKALGRAKNNYAFLQFTGGTTGTTKAAVITHNNVISNVNQLTNHFGKYISLDNLMVIIAFPFYHIFSIVFNVLFFMNNGGRCILFSELRDTDKIIDIFKQNEITFTVGVNTWYKKLMNHDRFAEIDTSTIKTSIAGGEYVPLSTKEQWRQLTGKSLYSAYGLTETSALAIVSPIDNTNIDDSIGIAIPDTEVALLDENSEVINNDDIAGEISLKGPQVTEWYYNNSEETKNAFTSGWFRTGDIAVRINGRFFKIIDRKKDMISVSGNKVYPTEVEEVLSKIEGILDVGVVAKKSEKSGEEVAACIVVKPGITLTDEVIIEYCSKYLARFKTPRLIFRFAELPKSPIGKTVRYELRNKINNDETPM